MRKTVGTVFVALLIVACTADFSSAQERQRGQRGARGGGQQGSQANLISDALVLDAQRAGDVSEIVDELRTEMRGDRQGQDRNQDAASREERQAAFQKRREAMQAALVEKLPQVLSKEEIDGVKPLLSSRGGRTDAELRALRQIEMGDATRAKLQALVLPYMNAVAALRPERQAGQRPAQGQERGQRGQGPSEEVREKNKETRDTLMADVKGVLTDDQVQAWEAQAEKVKKEMQSERQGGRGQRQGQVEGQGRGQRGQRGQRQGQRQQRG